MLHLIGLCSLVIPQSSAEGLVGGSIDLGLYTSLGGQLMAYFCRMASAGIVWCTWINCALLPALECKPKYVLLLIAG